MPTVLSGDDAMPRSDRRAWWGLAMLVLPVLLVSMDSSVLYLAMPTITDAINPTAAQQLWILDIYAFLIAGFLITMGTLGDRIGRRRILMAGVTVFGLASLLAAFASDGNLLIVARALMGIGGATLMPASLSLIANMFAPGRNRAKAIGLWTAAFAGGAAIGPVVGGFLLHHFWWGVVFLINIPVLLLFLAAAPFLLPEYRAPITAPFDVAGVILSLAGILPLVYAVKSIASAGVTPPGVLAGGFGLLMLAVFLLHQRRTPQPLVDLELFGNPRFSGAVAVALVGLIAQAGMSFITGMYLQSVLGHDVLAAAFAGLPMAVAVAVFSIGANRVTRRLGLRTAFAGAVTLSALGNLALLGLGTGSGLALYFVGTVLSGIGYGVAFSLVSEVVVDAAPATKSGAATGISETGFELGAALGLALLGSLTTGVFRARSGDHDFAGTLGETLQRAAEAGPAGEALADAARAAFVDGMHYSALVAAFGLAAVAVVLLFVMREKPIAEDPVEVPPLPEAAAVPPS